MLAVTLFGFMTTALIGGLVYGRASTATGGDRIRATQLADEGLEAVHNIKDAAFSNLADGTYGLVQSGGQWTLSGSSDTTDNFTRQIVITSNGTARKTVVATVSWAQGGSTSSVSATTQVADWNKARSWMTPALAGSLDLTGTVDAVKVATQGNYAYVIRNDNTPDFVIIDISNPASPSLVGSLSITGTATNIAVNGNYAYISTNNTAGELAIVNIATPTAPTLTGTYNAPGNAAGQGVAVAGTTVYLVRAANGGASEFCIINASTPSAPTLTGSYANNLSMREVSIINTTALVVTDTGRMLEISLTTPTAPVLGLNYALAGTGTALTIDVQGAYAYIGRGTSLLIYNLTTLGAPVLSSNTTIAGTINDLADDNTGTYVFMGTSNTAGEFQVANVSTPTAPTLSSVVDLTGTTSAVNGVAYNSTLNVVPGASASDTQEVPVFKPN